MKSNKQQTYDYGQWLTALPYGFLTTKRKHNFRYRVDPVPCLRKGGGRGYYRNPKTPNELKVALSYKGNLPLDLNEDMGPPPRRGRNQIPTLYDDIIRFPQRNWKKYRKTQYKNTGN